MAHRGTNEFDSASVGAALEELVERGNPSLGRAAKRLGTSTRTLQRHLATQGLSFRDLVSDARHRIALRLIAESDLPIQAIAERLGYSKPGGFSRAFARWTGMSPRAFRENAAARSGLQIQAAAGGVFEGHEQIGQGGPLSSAGIAAEIRPDQSEGTTIG